jgi:hypothetical protein
MLAQRARQESGVCRASWQYGGTSSALLRQKLFPTCVHVDASSWVGSTKIFDVEIFLDASIDVVETKNEPAFLGISKI